MKNWHPSLCVCVTSVVPLSLQGFISVCQRWCISSLLVSNQTRGLKAFPLALLLCRRGDVIVQSHIAVSTSSRSDWTTSQCGSVPKSPARVRAETERRAQVVREPSLQLGPLKRKTKPSSIWRVLQRKKELHTVDLYFHLFSRLCKSDLYALGFFWVIFHEKNLSFFVHFLLSTLMTSAAIYFSIPYRSC